MKDFFSNSVSKKQASDSGMAVVLILLLVSLFTGHEIYLKIAVLALIINMAYPMFYYYFAIFWFGFSKLLGTFVSKIILSIIFLFVVLPVGLIRRMMGKDSLQLYQFKKTKLSVMKIRNHLFTTSEIENPY
jgi:polyferredoxin